MRRSFDHADLSLEIWLERGWAPLSVVLPACALADLEIVERSRFGSLGAAT